MTTTIHLVFEEDVTTDSVFARPPCKQRMTPAREELAKVFLHDYPKGTVINDHATGKPRTSVETLNRRICAIAERNGSRTTRISPTVWKVVHIAPKQRGNYAFPKISSDGTRWGPTDFYDNVARDVVLAMRSGMDFDTGWMSCKKECLSSRVSRTAGITTFTVSVFDDFDTSGTGEAQARIRVKNRTDEQILAAIEKLGASAHAQADDDMRTNAGYAGFSVFDHANGHCVETYLVNLCGSSQPPGDNYSFWGWQSDRKMKGDKPNPKLGLPASVRAAFESHAKSLNGTPLRIGNFEIRPWN